MVKYYYIIQFALLASFYDRCSARLLGDLEFPKGFLFGVATAAYQIEGAWNVTDKGEGIWDRYTHKHRERVFDHKNGDEAADSYHRFREDVALLRQLGVNFYRFSISWPRILPNGFNNKISEDGVRYYNELIDELLKYNIEPLVTMYHWDLPQVLQDIGGWTNPIMADYFMDYTEVLFQKFGDRVKGWITFNEPFDFCQEGYGGSDAPGDRSSGIEDYMCGHTVLRAHGMVYNLYNKKYRSKQNGSLGITLSFSWLEPLTTSAEDEVAAEKAREFLFGWFAHPIFSETGDYPPIMRKVVDENSKRQNYPRSRLPTFTEEEIKMIHRSYDFLGLNHYTTYLVKRGNDGASKKPSFQNDMNIVMSQKTEWPTSNSTWLKVVPWGFRKSLNWIRNTYDNPPVVVTENGISLPKGLNDAKRVAYIEGYLRSMLLAMNKDKCLVLGYTYWSLIDNFEWMRGYSERFGLFEVDYESPMKMRTARKSATFYANVIKTHSIPSGHDNFSTSTNTNRFILNRFHFT